MRDIGVVTNKLSDNAKGIIWALIAVAIFSIIYVSGKLSGGNISAFQIIFLRYLGGLLGSLILLKLFKLSIRNAANSKIYVHFLRAAAGGGSGVAAIYAASNMRVVDATAIGLLDGMFTVMLAVIFLKEKISTPQFLSAMTCMIGAAIVVFNKGDSVQINLSLPAFVALVGAILVAVEGILIKVLSRSENAVMVLFFVNLFGAVIFSIPGIIYWSDTNVYYLLFFLILGHLSLLAQSCNIMAFRLADAIIIGPVRYSWIIFSTIIGYYIFSEWINTYTVIGISIIIISGISLASFKNKI